MSLNFLFAETGLSLAQMIDGAPIESAPEIDHWQKDYTYGKSLYNPAALSKLGTQMYMLNKWYMAACVRKADDYLCVRIRNYHYFRGDDIVYVQFNELHQLCHMDALDKSLSLMITGNSGLLFRKAWVRPGGKVLSSIGGLGVSANWSKGSGSEGSASSSMKKGASSSKSGSSKSSRDVAFTSSIGSGKRYDSVLLFKEWEIVIGNFKDFPKEMCSFPVWPS